MLYVIYKNMNKGTYNYCLSTMWTSFKDHCLDHLEVVMETDTTRKAKLWTTKCNNGYFKSL